MLVYINPQASAAITHRVDSICPDAPNFILCDFNHCTLTKTLKTYEQYMSYATDLKKSAIDLATVL